MSEVPAVPTGAPDVRRYQIADRDGNARVYTGDDFDEVLETESEVEMRRYLDLGWLLLDERVRRDPGKRDWLGGLLRTFARRELGPGEDPSYVAPSDVVTYRVGHLKPGRTGSPR